MISRRQLLYFSALLLICYTFVNLKCLAVAGNTRGESRYPLTQKILKEAYNTEMAANKHYDAYCQKALSENYPNIAYLFQALSVSEKIHADSYKKIMLSLGSTIGEIKIALSLSGTKKNLNTAATRELEKINKFYPEIINRLSSESHDQAVMHCMYAWKSHQQHEEIIGKVKKYSGFFFRLLAKTIEKMNPNFYVCEICGSTVDEKPGIPCEICNYPMYHYKNIERPILVSSPVP